MKKQFYIIMLGHSRVTPVALVDKSRTNVTKMTGNPSFTTPVPSLADITAAADRLDAAVQEYDFSRSRQDKEERGRAFTELKDMRTVLGAYVQSIAHGEQEMITSAGFETERVPQPRGLLEAPRNVDAKALPYPGQIEVTFAAVTGRQNYELFICEGDPLVEANWSLSAISGKNRIVVSGLVTDKQYFFHVVALGAAGASPVSNIAVAKAA